MEHAKKMVLIDPRMLPTIQQSNEVSCPQPNQAPSLYTHLPQTEKNIIQPESVVIDMTLNGLQQTLKDILQRPDLPDDQKAALHNHYLQQYLTMRRKQTQVYARPTEVKISELPPDILKNVVNPKVDILQREIVESAPKKLQKQARLLMQRIRDDPSVGWNEQAELVVDGNTVSGSNIVDLIGDMMRKRKDVTPVGWEIFASKLQEMNVPRELIRNSDRLNYMMGAPATVPSSRLSDDVVSSAVRGFRPDRPSEEEEEEEEFQFGSPSYRGGISRRARSRGRARGRASVRRSRGVLRNRPAERSPEAVYARRLSEPVYDFSQWVKY